MSHAGINPTDARNAGIIEYLRPEPVTLESIVRKLAAASGGQTTADIQERSRQILQRIESGPHRPDPPLSQPVDQAPHPWFGLGTHPDIISSLWKLDATLPQRCRWLLWGFPALVHPESGVVFAAARGTIGIFLRVPLEDPAGEGAALSLMKSHDIGAAGPAWHVLRPTASLVDYGRIAYDRAGTV